jgi:putative SOS response-associated peptidase YedK
MCGRYVGSEKIRAIVERFEADTALDDADWAPTWNAAPTDSMPVIIRDGAARRLTLMTWGWPMEWEPTKPHVNAKGETAAAKRTFASAFRSTRCIVPATAFYEWPEAPKRSKEKPPPSAFTVGDGGLFGIAGLWQPIEDGSGAGRFLLLTTPANAVVEPTHHRMAAILPRAAEATWLNPASTVQTLLALMVPLDAALMQSRRVSSRVNNVREDGPDLMTPLPPPAVVPTQGTIHFDTPSLDR